MHGIPWEKLGYSSAKLLNAVLANHCDCTDYGQDQDKSAGNSSVVTVRSEISQVLASLLPS